MINHFLNKDQLHNFMQSSCSDRLPLVSFTARLFREMNRVLFSPDNTEIEQRVVKDLRMEREMEGK